MEFNQVASIKSWEFHLVNSETKKGPLCSIWPDDFWKNKINAKHCTFSRISKSLRKFEFPFFCGHNENRETFKVWWLSYILLNISINKLIIWLLRSRQCQEECDTKRLGSKFINLSIGVAPY